MKWIILAGVFCSWFVMTGAAARAVERDGDLQRLSSCRQISDPDHRLRCFDDASAFLDALGAEKRRDASAAPINAASNPSSRDEDHDRAARFGSDDLARAAEEDEITELRATAVDIREDGRGKLIVELDNGQVWRQLAGDTNSLRIRRDKNGDGRDVIIKKRSLGAYALRMTTAKRSILVRRVR